MKKIMIAAVVSFFAANMAFAADTGCEAKAAEKKLAGAAKNSFMTKCEKDASAAPAPAACEAKAAEKKLAGAAKSSFMGKCEKDSAAAPAADKKMTQQNKMKSCNEEAAGKKGDERKAFMSSCLKK